MATKKPEVTEKAAVVSSSSEEEEVSDEESSDESSEDSKSPTVVEKQSTPTVAPSMEKKKPESESETESETDSDVESDSPPPVATKSVPAKSNTVTAQPESAKLKDTLGGLSEEPEKKRVKTEPTKSTPATAKLKPKKKKSKTLSTEIPVTTPVTKILSESFKTPKAVENKTQQTKSRPLMVGEGSEPAKTKAKKTLEVEPKEEVKKSALFQRIFSEEDEVSLLKGIVDFGATKPGDPFKDSEVLCEFIKKFIKFDVNQAQILSKVRRLKKKYENNVKRLLKKGNITFSKTIDETVFELSKKIWGNNVVSVKSDVKTSGSKMQIAGEEMTSFIKKEFVGSSGLSVADVIAVWDKVDEPSKLEFEKGMKKLKAKEMKLCFERIQFFADSAKMILNQFEK